MYCPLNLLKRFSTSRLLDYRQNTVKLSPHIARRQFLECSYCCYNVKRSSLKGPKFPKKAPTIFLSGDSHNCNNRNDYYRISYEIIAHANLFRAHSKGQCEHHHAAHYHANSRNDSIFSDVFFQNHCSDYFNFPPWRAFEYKKLYSAHCNGSPHRTRCPQKKCKQYLLW